MVSAHRHCITGCRRVSPQDRFLGTNMLQAGRDSHASLVWVSALLLLQQVCHMKSNLHQQPSNQQVHVFPADKDDMAETIITFQNAGFPLTVSRLCSLAYQHAKINGIKGFNDKKEMGGRTWAKCFPKRYPHIKVRQAKNLSIACAMAANEVNI